MSRPYSEYNVGYELVKAQQAEMRSLKEQDRLARQARTEARAQSQGWLVALWRHIRPVAKEAARTQKQPARTAPWPDTSDEWRRLLSEKR